MSAFTIDTFNNSQTKTLAKAHYKELYDNLAMFVPPPLTTLPHNTNFHTHSGEIKPLKQFCLPPLIKKLESRIIARGKTKMEWRLHGSPKAHVVSHRAAPLGEDYPDTAYRQVIVRLASTQSLKRGDSTSAFSGPKQRTNLPWLPDSARLKISHSLQSSRKRADEGEPKKLRNKVFEDNGKAKQVVEYLVMQKRVIRGREERDWKVWGFAEESTPERIEADEEYWRRTLDLQAGGL
jgi:protein MBA1